LRTAVTIRAARPDALPALVRRAESLLGGTVQRFVDPGGRLAVVSTDAVHVDDREAFVHTGYVNHGDGSSAAVRPLISLKKRWVGPPELRLTDSPGGIAAFFLVDAAADRVFAWSSRGGTEAVFWARGPEGIVIGNRPLFCHLLASGRETPATSTSWARRVLLGDSTLWDDTCFEDTWYATPRTTLVLDRGEVQTRPHPLAIGPRFVDRSPEGLDAFADTSLRAVEVMRGEPLVQLHLSGGKDSRVVAGLLARAGLPAECIVYSLPGIGEEPTAAAVARALGLPLRTLDHEISTGPAMVETMLDNLARQDGLLNENRQLIYPALAPTSVPILEGQAHHPRGGMLTMMQNRFLVKRRIHRQLTGDETLVDSAIGRERSARVSQLLRGYTVDHPADLSYWMYADWRMGRWLQPVWMRIRRARPLYWPMMDERVLEVTARLATWDRVSEYAFFAMMKRHAPALASLPLYDGIWRFDSNGADKTLFPEGFATRSVPDPERGGRKRTAEKRLSTVLPLFRMVMSDLRSADDLRSWIRPDVLPRLLDAGDDTPAALGLENQKIVRFMWKVVALGLTLDGRWFGRAP
jgi:hypothetical protein